MEKIFTVTGMSCSACKAHVQQAVMGLAGVQKAEVSLLQNRLTVEYNERLVAPSDIMQAVVREGYGIIAQEKAREARQAAAKEVVRLKYRFIFSGVWLLTLLYISMGSMFPSIYPAKLKQCFGLFAATQGVLTFIILWINRSFFSRGLGQFFHRKPTMDTLVSLGAGASFGYSIWHMVQGLYYGTRPDLYFESAAMIVSLVTLGKWLEARAKHQTFSALSSLASLLPTTAVVKKEGTEKRVPLADLLPGDVLVVRAGERIAADGFLRNRHCSVDESALTGESIPQEKEEGSALHAGTLLVEGYAEIEVQKTGEETILAQIISLVDQAAADKAPSAQLADRISAIFVPGVLVVAALTLLGWLWAGQTPAFALSCAVAVLVISCPCALGLATPTSVMVGMGEAAKRGILVKSAEGLERARFVSTVALDKTGTLTTGQLRVRYVFPVKGISKEEFIKWAASLEKPSSHPFARALVSYAAEQKIPLCEVTDFSLSAGLGVQARSGGEYLCGGNENAMRAWNIVIQRVLSQTGNSVLYFAHNRTYIGAVLFADTLKPSAASAVSYLKRLGRQVMLVSGDQQNAVAYAAREAGITEVRSELLPQQKEEIVRAFQQKGEQVALVGDGVNDAPALARADVSISFHSGTDLAAESSDMVLMKDDLNAIGVVLELSAAVAKNIKENLFWAFFYNVLGIPLAAGVFYPLLGWKLSPVYAAAAMSISSVCVVSNALRLRFFKPRFLEGK